MCAGRKPVFWCQRWLNVAAGVGQWGRVGVGWWCRRGVAMVVGVQPVGARGGWCSGVGWTVHHPSTACMSTPVLQPVPPGSQNAQERPRPTGAVCSPNAQPMPGSPAIIGTRGVRRGSSWGTAVGCVGSGGGGCGCLRQYSRPAASGLRMRDSAVVWPPGVLSLRCVCTRLCQRRPRKESATCPNLKPARCGAREAPVGGALAWAKSRGVSCQQ